jgi:chromosome segregation ATPase
MDTQLSLTLVEILVLMLGAITLGITIHFFIVSRRSLKASSPKIQDKIARELEAWKMRYVNDIEGRNKELSELKKKLTESEENNEIYVIEAEEMRKQNKQLQAEMNAIRTAGPVADKTSYIDQLQQAQTNLRNYNEKISELLGQIDIVKETEEKQNEIKRSNEELSTQLDELRLTLSQKEKELNATRQKQELTKEMSSMLDNAYTEFNVLQEKMQKLESQVSSSKMINLEFEDIREENYKIARDLAEQKQKHQAAVTENQQLQASLGETADKLREANFQRQQLQKRVAYLEELNGDMQAVADANKKLEGQIRPHR